MVESEVGSVVLFAAAAASIHFNMAKAGAPTASQVHFFCSFFFFCPIPESIFAVSELEVHFSKHFYGKKFVR